MATVVIVEDEDSLRETLSRYLTHEGYDVIAAASGYEALEAGIEAMPDVLVADWMLKSHVHGLHVSEVFRALHPQLNTILITGFSSRDLLEQSDRQGVLRLLEKPFDLQELQDAVRQAASATTVRGEVGPPIAVLAIGLEGRIQFSSVRACELLARAGLSAGPTNLKEVLVGDTLERLEAAESDWVEAQSRGAPVQAWLMRARRRPGRAGWLVILCPQDEWHRRGDPRLRLLLDEGSHSEQPAIGDPGPVIVIERDGVVRRLLVSQIERIGAICYPSDDLPSALRLLTAEPRVGTVLIDFTLTGHEMADWAARIRAIRPDAHIVGTGGVGAETDLVAQGVSRVLRKPWRITDLVSALAR